MKNLFELDSIAPVIAPSAWIADDAIVVGKVELADEVGLWFGTVIRGDNEWIKIGARTNIQEMCMLHTDMGFPLSVGEGCTIGHRALLHGCTIGHNTLIGMGAMVMNGAKIGNDCLIGAGAVVTEGKVIPDGSLVLGMPGIIKRELNYDEIKRNQVSAEHYVENMKRFRQGLKRV